MSVSMIAAVGQQLELGKNGGLIWPLPGDMRYFKATTMGHPVVMGLTTFQSLPGPLKGRKMYVLTREEQDFPPEVTPVTDLPAFAVEWQARPEELFVIGGGSIYRQFLPYASKLYLTEVEASCPEADVYFPEFDHRQYTKQVLSGGKDHDIAYNFTLYTLRTA